MDASLIEALRAFASPHASAIESLWARGALRLQAERSLRAFLEATDPALPPELAIQHDPRFLVAGGDVLLLAGAAGIGAGAWAVSGPDASAVRRDVGSASIAVGAAAIAAGVALIVYAVRRHPAEVAPGRRGFNYLPTRAPSMTR